MRHATHQTPNPITPRLALIAAHQAAETAAYFRAQKESYAPRLVSEWAETAKYWETRYLLLTASNSESITNI